jgi:hypothetical protein
MLPNDRSDDLLTFLRGLASTQRLLLDRVNILQKDQAVAAVGHTFLITETPPDEAYSSAPGVRLGLNINLGVTATRDGGTIESWGATAHHQGGGRWLLERQHSLSSSAGEKEVELPAVQLATGEALGEQLSDLVAEVLAT